MNKNFAVVAGVVGFLAACVGLYQAFSFSHYSSVRVDYRCSRGAEPGSGNIMEFLHNLDQHNGEVVMLDLNMCAGDFNRQVRENTVTRFFDSETFLQASGVDTNRTWPRDDAEWERAMQRINSALSAGQVTMQEISRDNGMRVTISGRGQTANPFSSLTIGSEGQDSASGPFQISVVSQGEAFEYMISPAPVTDHLAAEVRCARREWSDVAKFLLCPFF